MGISMHAFWTKGEENYKKALRIEYEAKCNELNIRLQQSNNPVEIKALTDELEMLKKTIKSDCVERVGQCFFGIDNRNYMLPLE